METNEIQKGTKKYTDAKAAGKSNKEAKKLAGQVSQDLCNLAWYRDARNPKAVVAFPQWDTMDEAARDAQVVIWRGEKGLSWGAMWAMTGEKEGSIRARFNRAAKIADIGHRTGKGGRWLANDPSLYAGNHKGLGTELTKEQLKKVREDEAARKAYLEKSAEYKSQLGRKVTAAKKAIKVAK